MFNLMSIILFWLVLSHPSFGHDSFLSPTAFTASSRKIMQEMENFLIKHKIHQGKWPAFSHHSTFSSFSTFVQFAQVQYSQIKDLAMFSDEQEKSLFLTPLLPLLRENENHFNQLSPKERYFQLFQLTHQFTSPPSFPQNSSSEFLHLSFAPLHILQEIILRYERLQSFHLSKLSKKDSLNQQSAMRLWFPREKSQLAFNKKELFFLEKILKRALWVEMSSKIFRSPFVSMEKRNLDITIFPIHSPKTLPPTPPKSSSASVSASRDFPYFSIKETNSAEQRGNLIYIFRQEELLKTLTHEIFHYLGVDIPLRDPALSSFITQQFSLQRMDKNGTPLLFEALTEAYAIITHTALNAVQFSPQIEPFSPNTLSKHSSPLTLALQLWRKEISFALFQSAKILYWSHFHSLEEFLTPSLHIKRLIESTSAVEYHLIKTLLIWDLEKLLSILMNHSLSPLDFQEQIKNLILTNCKNPLFHQLINQLIHSFKSYGPSGANSFFQSNLFQNQRMSLIEPSL